MYIRMQNVCTGDQADQGLRELVYTYMSSEMIGFKKRLQIPVGHGHVDPSLTLLRSRVEPSLVNMGLTRLRVHVKKVKGA